MPAGRAATARGIPVIAALAGILLSGCGLSFNSTGGEQAWHNGYVAGTAARAHHKFGHGTTKLHVTAFCAEKAVTDARAIKGPVVQWTEGFEKGCMRRLRTLTSLACPAARQLIGCCWS
jgi:hypothetical protein